MLVRKKVRYVIINSQNLRLNSTGDLADQRRNVFTTLLPYPGTGLSYGIANTTYRCNKKILYKNCDQLTCTC